MAIGLSKGPSYLGHSPSFFENPSCSACGHTPQVAFISFCTVQLRTLCAAHSLATLCLFTTSGSDPGELLGSMVFRDALIARKGSGNQQQQLWPTSINSFEMRRVLSFGGGGWGGKLFLGYPIIVVVYFNENFFVIKLRFSIRIRPVGLAGCLELLGRPFLNL